MNCRGEAMKMEQMIKVEGFLGSESLGTKR